MHIQYNYVEFSNHEYVIINYYVHAAMEPILVTGVLLYKLL